MLERYLCSIAVIGSLIFWVCRAGSPYLGGRYRTIYMAPLGHLENLPKSAMLAYGGP